jgi:hypothetical protein
MRRRDAGGKHPVESKLRRCALKHVADGLPPADSKSATPSRRSSCGALPHPTRPLLARPKCCVAPSLCWPASKCVAGAVRRRHAQCCPKLRAAGRTRTSQAIGTALAFSPAIGSTWIRRERHTRHLPQYQVRTTASPEFSHRLGSRDAVFISGAALPMTAWRRPMPSTLRKPRS